MKKAIMVMALVTGAMLCSTCTRMQMYKQRGSGQWSRFEEAVPMANAGA